MTLLQAGSEACLTSFHVSLQKNGSGVTGHRMKAARGLCCYRTVRGAMRAARRSDVMPAAARTGAPRRSARLRSRCAAHRGASRRACRRHRDRPPSKRCSVSIKRFATKNQFTNSDRTTW
ncbi:hypothetical protein BMA721280_J0060 [Burkholderia mallei 2002721280]|nr:hypothetical protein BMAFMH_K0483 [Burkholderia mallei FMH]EDK82931.1 hypothetical protein BMA721280_J0060 [Burkholderia mallei 2002721280]EDP86877.1 hypothetical protein BMA10399_H0161 [Burkholderia mallei ATCC 10399]EEP84382.1 conserved hypothetical protein [Burkholderia mallei GB8 horse 4]